MFDRFIFHVFFCLALLVATQGHFRLLAQAGNRKPASIGSTPPKLSSEQRALLSIPHYQPSQQVSGTIRLWGHGAPILNFMGPLVQSWEHGFRKYQPGVHFVYDMYGTASAMGALYSGAGDIAILGQEIYPFEVTAFRRVKHYPPLIIEIATGSLDVRNFDFAIQVFVNNANPLSRLTLGQINDIFAYQRDGRNITTWGQLGLTGKWASQPVHLYGWRADDVFSTFVQNAALNGSHEWRCSLKEYANIHLADGKIYDSGQQILDALVNDPDGIALSNVRYAHGGVKPLAVARRTNGPYYQATKESLIAQQYPLGRMIPAIIDRAPGKPVNPAIKEFLLYLLSREGQAAIVRNGKYLPLSAQAAANERRKLE